MRDAVGHVRVLCALGLPPEEAMVHLAPLLREVVPGGFARLCLFDRAGGMRAVFNECELNQQLAAAHVAEVVPDPLSPMALVGPAWAAKQQGVYLPLAHAYRRSPFHDAVKRPSDVDRILDVMVHRGAPPVAGLQITRPPRSCAFTPADLAKLEVLRPHLALALSSPIASANGAGVRSEANGAGEEHSATPRPSPAAGPLLCGVAVVGPDDRLREVSREFIALLRLLDGQPWRAFGDPPASALPAPCREVIHRVRRPGSNGAPPVRVLATPWGRLEIRATLLLPLGMPAADAVRDPAAPSVVLHAMLSPSTLADAWRSLRRQDVSPTQAAVGARLLVGRHKGQIARDLGVERTSVEDAARKLFARLDVHSVVELDTRVDG